MRRLFLYVIIGAATHSSISQQAQAGPDDIANWLMTDSVSMMDWGNFRLETFLNQEDRYGSVDVTYNWDRNLIEISGSEFSNDSAGEFNEDACQAWIESVRIAAYVGLSDGKVLQGIEHSRFASFYKHSGFYRQPQGKTQTEMLSSLDNLFHLSFSTWRKQADSIGYSLSGTCSGFLLSNRISFER